MRSTLESILRTVITNSTNRNPSWVAGALCLTLLLALPLTAIAQPAPLPEAVDANYRFGPEDVLRIEVWGHPDLSGTVVVSFSGVIRIPSLGAIEASGRTPVELSAELTRRYQILEPTVPDVIVSVLEYRSRSVTVLGEVRQAGRYGFRELPDLWGAILSAGGPTPSADLGEVQIVRDEGGTGIARVIVVDISMGVEAGDTQSLPELQPNDRILIPSSEAAAPARMSFQVMGAVNRPGSYRISVADNVVEALSVAGGPTREANLKKVYLTRVTDDGAVSHELNINGYLKEAKPLANLDLEPGDTITIFERRSFWRAVSEVSGRLLPLVSLGITLAIATN